MSEEQDFVSAFIVLDLPFGASKEEVKQSYRQMVLLYHPDQQQGRSDAIKRKAEKLFKQINNANRIIMDVYNSNPNVNWSIFNKSRYDESVIESIRREMIERLEREKSDFRKTLETEFESKKTKLREELIKEKGRIEERIKTEYEEKLSNIDLDPKCPICGLPMVEKLARKGPNAGSTFYGCSTFPKCRGTRPKARFISVQQNSSLNERVSYKVENSQLAPKYVKPEADTGLKRSVPSSHSRNKIGCSSLFWIISILSAVFAIYRSCSNN